MSITLTTNNRNMSKVTIPSAGVQVGGTLHDWYYNNCVLRSDVVKTNDGINAIAEDNFSLTRAEVNNIMTAGGQVEKYLMGVRANMALMGDDIPSSLPNYKTLNTSGVWVAKTFSNWFSPGAEIWIKDDNTEFLFYSNPFAGNEDKYLNGTELVILNGLTNVINVLTIAQSEALTASGWTKVV